MTVPTDKPRRRKWPWRVLWGMLFLAGGISAEWGWRYRSALAERDRLFEELRSRGEPTTELEIVEKLRRERRDGTGAEALLKASKLSDELEFGPNEEDPVRVIDGDFKKNNPEPCVHELVERRIRGYDAILKLMEDAARRPPGILSDEKSQSSSSQVAGWPSVRGLAALLFWVQYDALAKGDHDRAYRAIWLRFSLLEATSRNPVLTGQMVRLAPLHEDCERLKFVLSYAGPNELRFREFDALLARTNDNLNVRHGLELERAAYLSLLDDPKEIRDHADIWRKHGPGSRNGWTTFREDASMELLATPLGRPAILREQCEYIRLVNRMEKIIDRPDVEWRTGEEVIKKFIQDSPFAKRTDVEEFHQYANTLAWLGRLAPNAHRRLVLARIALRLRRHYDIHGSFPEALEAVCDKTMPTINLEWFQNLPLVYKPRKDGFLLDVSDELEPGAGFRLRPTAKDVNTVFAWDVTLKTLKRQGAAK